MESNPISEEPATNWLELPEDIMTTILLKVDAFDILSTVQNVCSSWRKICKDPFLWRVVDTHNLVNCLQLDTGYDYDLEKMCMQAVGRSCGQLVDINIEHFGTDDLLLQISQSSKQLRRLRVLRCFDISGEGMTEAVTKFPLLEHLEIFDSAFSVETLETAGWCCPLLKTLKLNCRRGPIEFESDEEALAIAENMPNLQNLQICGNPLTDKGLQAILDGCPHLESLDLRRCSNLDFAGQLQMICSGKLKTFRLPREPFDDSETLNEIFGYDVDDYDENFSIDFSETDDADYYAFFSGGSGFSYTDFCFC